MLINNSVHSKFNLPLAIVIAARYRAATAPDPFDSGQSF